METKRSSDNNEIINLELVLEQIANEQKSQTKSTNELVLAINSMSGHITNFEEEIRHSKSAFVLADNLSIQEIINKAFTDIKLIVATQQQKTILKKYQLLLFPEQDARLFYKIVFGRWFLWLIAMLFLTNLYKFAVHMNDNQSEVNLQLLKNDRLVRSWNYLYSKSDKGTKKLMENAYLHSGGHE